MFFICTFKNHHFIVTNSKNKIKNKDQKKEEKKEVSGQIGTWSFRHLSTVKSAPKVG
jgi:hypothetical protein